ncbi:MAG: GNAT family protein [Planctomycetota bacterium]
MQPVVTLKSERLELVPSSPSISRAAPEDRIALGEMLNCAISDRWPAELIARELEPVADQVEDDPDQGVWTIWYAVDREEHVLVGNVRFASPPSAGEVEVIYAMADDMYGRGYATEAVASVCGWALGQSGVNCVYAMVNPENAGAIRVLEKAGFAKSTTQTPGEQRYELSA